MSFNITFIILPVIILSLVLTIIWTGILTFGWLYYLYKKFIFRKEDYNYSEIKPKVSIIIPARNESAVVGNLISDVLYQNYKNFELIVACNNCTDKNQTYKIAKEFELQDPLRIKVLNFQTKIKGKGPALNHALKEATGDIVCILDADNRIEEDFLSKIIPYFDDRSVAGIQARYKVLNKKQGIIPRLINIETLIYVECFQDFCNLFNFNSYFGGTGMCIRKTIIDDINWGDSLVEDYELSLKLIANNYKIRSATNVLVYDEKPNDWSSLINQRKRWLKGMFPLITRFYKIVSKPLHYALLLAPINLLFSALLPAFYWFNVATAFEYFNYWYLPVYFWLPIFLFNLALSFGIILTKEPKEVWLLPFYLFIFANHWIIVLFASFTVKGWSETKTTHYGVISNA